MLLGQRLMSEVCQARYYGEGKMFQWAMHALPGGALPRGGDVLRRVSGPGQPKKAAAAPGKTTCFNWPMSRSSSWPARCRSSHLCLSSLLACCSRWLAAT